ncbi:uncharacterized protein LOC100375393 [Saccoglossus kowalevskii]
MSSLDPKSAKDVVDTTRTLQSPATKFEVKLLEDTPRQEGKKTPTEGRMISVMNVFDEVIPQLGVYSQLMKMVRDEVFEAIYSQQYTSTTHQTTNYKVATNKQMDKQSEDHVFIQRIPYFTLIQRVFDQRNEEADELREQLDLVKKKLHDKHKEFEGSITVNTALKKEIHNLREIVKMKNGMIEKNEDDIAALQDDLEDLRDSSELQKKNLENEKEALEVLLKTTQNEVEFLTQYKKGYDELEDAFTIKGDPGFRRKKKKPVIATRRAHLLNNIASAKKLEEQLLTVENKTIEEFDVFLEDHKRELEERILRDNYNDAKFDEEEHELEKMDKELQNRQETFQKTIMSLNEELSMVRQHRESLEHQWEELEGQFKLEEEMSKAKPPSSRGRPTSKDSLLPNMSSVLGSSRPNSQSPAKDSVMSLGEDFDNIDPLNSEMDPFVPQETILSKYSSMIYTSTNHAKTFNELKDAKFCSSCGEKTVICPHKIGGDKIVILPHNCTHIKLSRPKVRINVEAKERLAEALYQKPDTSESTKLSTKRIRGRISITTPMRPLQSIIDSPASAEQSPAIFREEKDTTVLGASQEHQVNSFLQLWEDFKKRTPLTRDVARPLEMGRTLSLIGQFYAHLLWQDEYALDDEQVSSILTVQTFAHILVGNLDAGTFRYLLTIADLIDIVEWKEVADFRAFASALYPFLTEDELEQLSLGYTSFSENKISKGLVSEYFMYIVLKYREPRFQDCEAKLLQHPGKEQGMMSDKEFSEAVDAIAPLANEKLRSRLFREAQATNPENTHVSIMKLSQITAYLLLQQIFPLLKQTLQQKIGQSRIRPVSELSFTTSTITFESRVVEDEFELMSFSKLRNLAKNISRRANVRSMRRIENDLTPNVDVFREEDEDDEEYEEYDFQMEEDDEDEDFDDEEEVADRNVDEAT